jgi:hypothetical protein
VAVAAMAVATVARADAGNARSTVYANPVLQFLANHSDPAALAATGIPRVHRYYSARRANKLFSAGAGSLGAILQVEFVGLVAPLNLTSARMDFSDERDFAEPSLPCLFQRPPPFSR